MVQPRHKFITSVYKCQIPIMSGIRSCPDKAAPSPIRGPTFLGELIRELMEIFVRPEIITGLSDKMGMLAGSGGGSIHRTIGHGAPSALSCGRWFAGGGEGALSQRTWIQNPAWMQHAVISTVNGCHTDVMQQIFTCVINSQRMFNNTFGEFWEDKFQAN